MDKIVALLTTSEGRIGRQQWWIGGLVMIVIALVGSLVLNLIAFGNFAILSWLYLLLNLALLWPTYNLGMKRRHDRDNDGMDLKIFLGVSVLLNLLAATAIGYTITDVGNGLMLPQPPFWLTALNLLFGIFAIYLFVQLGFLKGTTGSNSYGADPVGAAA
ncbi:MAG: DUF805 domain-containing protein [Devosia sp.]|uniref:DUF805 domain-containing protein n=1 Tax=Devosia sp. TaxID=1871048 RepID=UPI003391E64A